MLRPLDVDLRNLPWWPLVGMGKFGVEHTPTRRWRLVAIFFLCSLYVRTFAGRLPATLGTLKNLITIRWVSCPPHTLGYGHNSDRTTLRRASPPLVAFNFGGSIWGEWSAWVSEEGDMRPQAWYPVMEDDRSSTAVCVSTHAWTASTTCVRARVNKHRRQT